MRLPLWDAWLFGADIFLAMLPNVRILWLGGFYGSGKTVLATFLAAWLVKKRLSMRVMTNIEMRGQSPVVEYVPDGMRYYSAYLKKWFESGEQLPMEDTCMVLDEGGRWLKHWDEAQDYVAALRKTNLYFLIPSINRPVSQLTNFEVRRTRNLYGFGIPAWQFTWFLTNGKSVSERGQFYLWRPHRLFGVSETFGWPVDDAGLVDALEYTFSLDVIRENKAKSAAKRKLTKVLDFGAFDDAVSSMAETMEQQAAAQVAGGGRARKR